MRQIRIAAQVLELRGRTLWFVVFLILSGEAYLYYAVRQLLSDF